MRKLLILASVAAMAVPALTVTLTPVEASASARGCRNTGTAIGGVTGAVVGSNLASGGGRTGGAILGGLVGAVAGHEIAKSNCAPTAPPTGRLAAPKPVTATTVATTSASAKAATECGARSSPGPNAEELN